jgi:hypothetical protein
VELGSCKKESKAKIVDMMVRRNEPDALTSFQIDKPGDLIPVSLMFKSDFGVKLITHSFGTAHDFIVHC